MSRHITIEDGNVVQFPTTYDQLIASRDLLDLGECLCLSGSALNSVGRHVLQLNEPPTDLMLCEAANAASRVLAAVLVLRLSYALSPAVDLPSDSEPA